MKSEISDNREFYHPVEQAILCDWLGHERPSEARDIDLEARPEEGAEAGGPVGLALSCNHDTNEFTLTNAVARLVLEGIQQRLPTSAVCYGDHVVLTREYAPKSPRKLDLLPRFLFQINWANSGPGISWPVAYYVTWLPLYDVFVITESADSPEARGYCDRALGWFERDIPVEEGVRRVIIADWRNQYDEYDQEHWENFWDEGLISSEDVWAWAAEVWCDKGENGDEVDVAFL